MNDYKGKGIGKRVEIIFSDGPRAFHLVSFIQRELGITCSTAGLWASFIWKEDMDHGKANNTLLGVAEQDALAKISFSSLT